MKVHVAGGLFGAKWTVCLALFCVSLGGCRRQVAPRLPPPVYQQPSLPEWEPPAGDDAGPFDWEGLAGEAVEDDEEALEEGQVGEPGEPTQSDAENNGEAESSSGAESNGEAESSSEAGVE